MRNRIITVLYSRVHRFTPHGAAAAQTVFTVRNRITIVIGRRYRVTSFLCERLLGVQEAANTLPSRSRLQERL